PNTPDVDSAATGRTTAMEHQLFPQGMKMKITSDLFHPYLKCSTKCWLRATNEPATENDYPNWVKAQNQSYRAAEVARLVAASPTNEVAHSPDLKGVNTASWRLATNLMTDAQLDSNVLESDLHAVQLVPAKDRSSGRDQTNQEEAQRSPHKAHLRND